MIQIICLFLNSTERSIVKLFFTVLLRFIIFIFLELKCWWVNNEGSPQKYKSAKFWFIVFQKEMIIVVFDYSVIPRHWNIWYPHSRIKGSTYCCFLNSFVWYNVNCFHFFLLIDRFKNYKSFIIVLFFSRNFKNLVLRIFIFIVRNMFRFFIFE